MRALSANYTEWAIRLLLYIAGAASTFIGSWLSSKIRVYHDARNSHRDELKQAILEPLRESLRYRFEAPRYEIKWNQQNYNPQASAQESPVTLGPVMLFGDPCAATETTLDEALLEDARLNHYRRLVLDWQRLKESSSALIFRVRDEINAIAQELLNSSHLPAHPSSTAGRYVMQLDLAGFVYQRLVLAGFTNLDIVQESTGGAVLRVGQSQSAAMGSMQEMANLMTSVDSLIEAHRPFALELQNEVARLEAYRVVLARRFSLAIAGKKLRGRCSLVRFF